MTSQRLCSSLLQSTVNSSWVNWTLREGVQLEQRLQQHRQQQQLTLTPDCETRGHEHTDTLAGGGRRG